MPQETKTKGGEVFGTPEEDYTLGMVLDQIERVGELRLRDIEIKSTSSTNLFAPIRIEVGFDVFENSIEILLQKSRVMQQGFYSMVQALPKPQSETKELPTGRLEREVKRPSEVLTQK